MTRPPLKYCLHSLDDTTPFDVVFLLASARSFKQAGSGARPLRGRHAAVLCEAPADASAEVFAAAATALGATVVRILPSTMRLGDGHDAQEAARILGQLYCAVGCNGVSPAVAAQLARWAGVPVFEAVAGDTHPTRLLGDLLTMCEHAHKPMAEITLCVVGDPRSPLALAWQRMGQLSGIGVCTGACGADAGSHRSDFVCEPRPTDRPDSLPVLLAVDRDGGPPRPLFDRQNENHRCIVQALLSDTVA